MKDLILGFKLLRYGYKLKTNVMMLILFTAIGFVIELSSHGTNMLGGFYFMLTGMFAYQMIIYMNASDYVQSSVMKRKLEVGMPVIVSTVVYLVLFTILVAEKYILIRMYPENTENYQDTLFMIIFILFGAMIFCGVCYKYFVASFIVFMLVIITCMSTISSWLCHHHIQGFHAFDVHCPNCFQIVICKLVFHCHLVKLAVLGYAAILLGGVIEYLISSLLYRKQLSEYAMSGLSKSMK